MATWAEFESAERELAASGVRLLSDKLGTIALLATVRRDGAPRLHPVSPVVTQGSLFVFVGVPSPKRGDLLGDGRYVMHALPGKDDVEFLVEGRASPVDDPDIKAAVSEAASFAVSEEDTLFELSIDKCLWGIWENVGQPNTRPIRKRWEAG